jgi:acyl-CoA synthetase (AMP-forming)/AMP-acid ligase II
VTEVNVAWALERAAQIWPGKEAIADGVKCFTYEQVFQRVCALSHALVRKGFKPQERLAVLLPNCSEYLELYFAAARAGIVLVPINYRLAPLEIAHILGHSDAKGLVAHTDFIELVGQSVEDILDSSLDCLFWVGEDALDGNCMADVCGGCKSEGYEDFLQRSWGKSSVVASAQAESLLHLYYTSGTTGRPKGVMLSQLNVYSNALAACAELGLDDGDVWAHIAPLFHLVDAWAIFSVTYAGGKHVFLPYFKASLVGPLLDEQKVTMTALVPTMVSALLHDANTRKHSYENLAYLFTAGSPIAPELVRKIEETFGCIYAQYYGMTETSPFLTISLLRKDEQSLPFQETLELRASTGRPFLGTQVMVVRADDTPVERDGIEVGEIIAKGPNVTCGYWMNQKDTEAAIKDGWIYTGDLAVVNSLGYINIVDRKKDMIISGGENVYSTEVEYVLHEHPAILDCAVYGIPDKKWGELVHASLVLKPGFALDEEQVISFVKERLAHYKAPRKIEFLDEMPRTGSGKILKKKLRDRFWAETEKRVN